MECFCYILAECLVAFSGEATVSILFLILKQHWNIYCNNYFRSRFGKNFMLPFISMWSQWQMVLTLNNYRSNYLSCSLICYITYRCKFIVINITKHYNADIHFETSGRLLSLSLFICWNIVIWLCISNQFKMSYHYAEMLCKWFMLKSWPFYFNFLLSQSYKAKLNFKIYSSYPLFQEHIVYPKMAKNAEGSWLFVINQGEYRQGVRVEKCL